MVVAVARVDRGTGPGELGFVEVGPEGLGGFPGRDLVGDPVAGTVLTLLGGLALRLVDAGGDQVHGPGGDDPGRGAPRTVADEAAWVHVSFLPDRYV